MKKEELKNIFTNELLLSSDHHFGHLRCFKSFEKIRQTVSLDFNEFEQIIASNLKTSNNLLHLGDFTINKKNPNKTLENIKEFSNKIFKDTNGKKILLLGNHDYNEDLNIYINNGWDYVINRPHILLNDKLVILDKPENIRFSGVIITEIKGFRVMFSHFGIFQEDKRFESKFKNEFRFLNQLYKKYECVYNIHGHSHGNADNTEHSLNVSIENCNFKPISFIDCIKRININN